MRLLAPRSLMAITAALLVGVVLTPATADAARLTKAEKAAWNRANVSCKAEGKAKKLGFFARRRFVKGCIVQSLKGYPNINVERILKTMDTKKFPMDPREGENAI
jgi:hypothetical protein